MKRLLAIGILAVSSAMSMTAQSTWDEKFKHLDLSISGGTTGIGFDLTTPITKWMDIRAGGTFMPHVNVDANFKVTAGKIEGSEFIEMDNFGKMSSFFKDFTGYEVKDNVTVNGHPTGNNFSFMVDFKPAKNWHVTVGFLYGTSEFAKGINSMSDAATLVGVGMYNHLHDNLMGINLPSSLSDEMYNRMIESRDSYGDKPWITIGDMDLSIDPEMSDDEVREYSNKVTTALVNGMFDGGITSEDLDWTLNNLNKLRNNGRAGVYIGKYTHSTYERDSNGEIKKDENGNPVYKRDAAGNEMRKGYPYVMIPGEDATARVSIRTNRFKPYLGFGYGKEIGGKHISGLKLSFDAGVLFWGGSPKVIMHDGTDLVHDVEGIQHKIGDYVRSISSLKVYPVLNLRITKRLF